MKEGQCHEPFSRAVRLFKGRGGVSCLTSQTLERPALSLSALSDSLKGNFLRVKVVVALNGHNCVCMCVAVPLSNYSLISAAACSVSVFLIRSPWLKSWLICPLYIMHLTQSECSSGIFRLLNV